MTARPRVLVADDYPAMARAVRRLLEADCEVVGTVSDGSALLEAAQRLQPDVIIVDLNLPKLHGLEACRQIAQVNPAIKIIVFTAMSDPDLRQQSLNVGAAAFVSKLAPADELRSTVNRLFVDRGRSDS